MVGKWDKMLCMVRVCSKVFQQLALLICRDIGGWCIIVII
jgi:hypothetical protein